MTQKEIKKIKAEIARLKAELEVLEQKGRVAKPAKPSSSAAINACNPESESYWCV